MSAWDNYRAAEKENDEWEEYKKDMQRQADAAKGQHSTVRKAIDYDPDQEPVATKTSRMHMHPIPRKEHLRRILGGQGENTGKEYNNPQKAEDKPVATNTGKMYGAPTRSQHLKKITDDSYKTETTKRNDAKLKNDETKARETGKRKAMPFKEKVQEGIISGAAVAGQTARATKKGIDKLQKTAGKTQLAKEMKQITVAPKRGRSPKGTKKQLPTTKNGFVPNVRGAGPTNTRNTGTLNQQHYGTLNQQRELPTGNKDMSALSVRSGSPFGISEPKNPLGTKKSVNFGKTEVKNPLGDKKSVNFGAKKSVSNPMGDAPRKAPFAVGNNSYNSIFGASKVHNPFGEKKSYNPLGR